MKQKILTLALILTVIQFPLRSQTKFVRGYADVPFKTPPSKIGGGLVELKSGHLIILTYAGKDDWCILKTDSAGHPVWTKKISDGITKFRVGVSYTIENGGNNDFYLAGKKGADSIVVIKADENGIIKWQKSIVSNSVLLNSIMKTKDDGLICCISKKDNEGIIVRFDKDGNIQWQRKISASTRIFFTGATELANGDLVFCGLTGLGPATVAIVCKTDGNGMILWSKKCVTNSTGRAIKLMDNGNLRMLMESPFGYLDLDAGGTVTGGNSYGTTVLGFNSFINSTGEIFITLINLGEAFKISANGDVGFSNTYAIPGYTTYSRGIIETRDKGFIFTGGYTSDPFNHMFVILVKGVVDGKTINGFFTPSSRQKTAYTNTTTSLTMADSAVTCVKGVNLSLTAISQFYDTSFGTATKIISIATNDPGTSIYPNPATDELMLKSLWDIREMRIYDTYGKEVLFTQVEQSPAFYQLSTSSLPNGIYYIEIRGVEKVAKGKFIVQH